MRKLKLFLRRPFFAAPGPVSFLEYLPVSGDEAAALRLYENYNRSSDNITYYALQPDGDLIAWGGAPGKLYSGYFPYFMRRKNCPGCYAFYLYALCGPIRRRGSYFVGKRLGPANSAIRGTAESTDYGGREGGRGR